MSGGGGDRREDGESGTWVWERGVSASQGRARGDGACTRALKLVTSLPAAFLPVAKLRLSSAQPRLQNPPAAGFAPLSRPWLVLCKAGVTPRSCSSWS